VPDKRRHGGKRGGKKDGTDQWARWQFLATVARMALAIYELLRDHVVGGPGSLPF
jgi:hypothetical protein